MKVFINKMLNVITKKTLKSLNIKKNRISYNKNYIKFKNQINSLLLVYSQEKLAEQTKDCKFSRYSKVAIIVTNLVALNNLNTISSE